MHLKSLPLMLVTVFLLAKAVTATNLNHTQWTEFKKSNRKVYQTPQMETYR
jgi:hypothetical protein